MIYYFRATAGRVYLLLAYAKGTQESISTAEKNAMRQLTARLQGEQ